MILKSMLEDSYNGKFSAAGVNLLESLEIAKSVSNNVIILEALENVKKGLLGRHIN